MRIKNLYKNISGSHNDELIEKLLENKDFFVERIISEGHKSPKGFWYDQDTNEFILLLKGSAEIEIYEQEIFNLIPGDYLIIPSHIRHRVNKTDTYEKTIWLTIHYNNSKEYNS